MNAQIKYNNVTDSGQGAPPSAGLNKFKSSPKKVFNSLVPHGSIAFGYDYGFLPYTVNSPVPAQAFKTEGSLDVNVLKIPLEISFFYTTQKNIIGFNNYFRVNYNASRYREQIKNSRIKNLAEQKTQLGKLYQQRQNLQQQIAYSEYLNGIPVQKWPSPTNNLELPTDSLSKVKLESDNLNNPFDSLSPHLNSETHLQKKDSLKKVYGSYLDEFQILNDSIRKLEKQIASIEQLKGLNPNSVSQLNDLSKKEKVLAGVQNFQVGLCYPNHSPFLASSIPVRGVNLEWEQNKMYVAFTYGTTLSTLMSPPNTLQGILNNSRNNFNYFDFNRFTDGRKILVLKTGFGSKNGNHLHGGILIGRGLSSYVRVNPETGISDDKQLNIVAEIDAKYSFTNNLKIEVTTGKSSVGSEALDYEAIKNGFEEIFSRYRSYAVLGRLTAAIPKSKSNITASVRYIDPFFKSFGVGFLRSDNLRYELKADQQIGKKLRVSSAFRYEEDNLLNLISYQNRFYSIVNSATCRLNRRLLIRTSYTPLVREVHSNELKIRNDNSITTAILSYQPRFKKGTFSLSALYSYYLIDGDSAKLNMQNVNLTQQVFFKSGWKFSLSSNWFRNNSRDTLNNDVILNTLECAYSFKNGSLLSAAAKMASRFNGELKPGFILKSSIRLHKLLFWELQAEKFIVGDLFNGYNLEQLNKFPYNFNTRFILNF